MTMQTQFTSLQDLAAAVDTASRTHVDAIYDTRELRVASDSDSGFPVLYAGNRDPIAMSQWSMRQIGSWSKVPAKYVDRMAEDAPDLLAINLNHWLHASSDTRRMLRMRSTPTGGELRAFLSDSYRRIDNSLILRGALEGLLADGFADQHPVSLKELSLDERAFSLKIAFPATRGEVKVGDTVESGVSVRNSEIGGGSAVVEPFVYRLVCTNGMVVADKDVGMRRRHVGRRAAIDDNGESVFSQETVDADDRAIALKVRDHVRSMADPERFDGVLTRLRDATETAPVENPVKAAEVLAKTAGLTEGESAKWLENLLSAGDRSLYGAAQAVTALANDEAVPMQRAQDLHVIGGQLIDLPAASWTRIATAA